jgi:hypothetical protein
MFGKLTDGPAGQSDGDGLWIERPSGAQIIFRADTNLPGTTSKFGDYFLRELAFENTGRVAVNHYYANGHGLWILDAPGSTSGRLIARSGNNLRGVYLSSINDIHMANWRIVFHVEQDAIFTETLGILELVAAENQPAVGFGPDAVYREVFPEITTMNRDGDVAFVGTVSKSDEFGAFARAIWFAKRDRPVELALNFGDLMGTPPPGAGPPTVRQMAMNEQGQLAFLGIGETHAMWWFDPTLGSRRVAALGDVISLTIDGQRVSKTITAIDVARYLPGRLSPPPFINDTGEVVFSARFHDHTQAVLAWSPVPEPSSALLTASLLTAAACARRRHRDLLKPILRAAGKASATLAAPSGTR